MVNIKTIGREVLKIITGDIQINDIWTMNVNSIAYLKSFFFCCGRKSWPTLSVEIEGQNLTIEYDTTCQSKEKCCRRKIPTSNNTNIFRVSNVQPNTRFTTLITSKSFTVHYFVNSYVTYSLLEHRNNLQRRRRSMIFLLKSFYPIGSVGGSVILHPISVEENSFSTTKSVYFQPPTCTMNFWHPLRHGIM